MASEPISDDWIWGRGLWGSSESTVPRRRMRLSQRPTSLSAFLSWLVAFEVALIVFREAHGSLDRADS